MESGPFGSVAFENSLVPDFRRYFPYFLYLTFCLVISSFHLDVNKRINTNLNFLSSTFLNDFPTLSFLFFTADNYSTCNIYLYIHYDSSPRDDTMHNFSLSNAYPVHLNDSETFLPLPELIRRHVRLIQKNSLSISFHSFRIFISTVYFP